MNQDKLSITDPSVVYTFALNKKTFERIWHYIFCQNKTPYAYWEMEKLWELMTCEHQNTLNQVKPEEEQALKNAIGLCEGITIGQAEMITNIVTKHLNRSNPTK